MKKHIIIAGVPRSGKSTISQKISKNLGYQHISMDSIIAGIEGAFPETGINSDADADLWQNIRFISSKMARFIRAMTDSGEYDECGYGMVIDIFQLLPEHYVRHIDSSVCEIYYFGTADVTPQERYELLKAYDTPKDYTYHQSEAENKEDCGAASNTPTLGSYKGDETRLQYLGRTNDTPMLAAGVVHFRKMFP